MAGICRSHNQPMRWPNRTRGEKLMTARNRWVIGVSAIVLVIAVVAFLGTMRSRNSLQAHGIASENAAAPVVFASPGRVEGRPETSPVVAAHDAPLNVYFHHNAHYL